MADRAFFRRSYSLIDISAYSALPGLHQIKNFCTLMADRALSRRLFSLIDIAADPALPLSDLGSWFCDFLIITFRLPGCLQLPIGISALSEILFSGVISRMKHLFRKLRERFPIEGLIQLIQLLVPGADLLIHCGIFLKQAFDPFFSCFISRFQMLRLTSAANTAARAGHDFDEIKVLQLLFFQETADICRSVNHCSTQAERLCKLYFSSPDAFIPAQCGKMQQLFRCRLVIQVFICRSQGCFHDAAGRSEDHAGTALLRHQGIVIRLLKRAVINAGFLRPADELSRRDAEIHVSE